MNRAEAWREKGRYFSWSPRSGDAAEVQIFHVELGDANAPPLVLVHGFPTSSVDWFEVAERLSDRYRVCAMDFPGFGLSDKPKDPYVYSIYDDARLLVHAITQVWELKHYTLLTHDRGSSVGMIALAMRAHMEILLRALLECDMCTRQEIRTFVRELQQEVLEDDEAQIPREFTRESSASKTRAT